jgi:APA family basic amino acid/polyamine antiporter
MSQPTADSSSPLKPSELVRSLGLGAATAIVIGDTIGTGVFLVSSDMARLVGSTTLVFAAWIFGAIIVLFGAFCYAELGAMFPKAGGPYVYLNEGLGPLWGFLFGWMSACLERPAAMAALAAGSVRFLSFFFPVVAAPLFTWHIGNSQYVFTNAQPLAAFLIIVVVALNYLSVHFSGAVQVLLTSLKVGTLLIIIGFGLAFAHRHALPPQPAAPPLGPGAILALLTGVIPALWALNGFNDLGDVGEEIKNPERNIPRAILFGLLAIAALYLSANFVYFRILSFAQIAGSLHVASDAVQAFAGAAGASWLTAAMAISALGALHVVVLTGARIPYAMARDGVFFRFAEKLHPKFRTPSGSLIFLGIVGSLLAFSGTYEELYSLFVFAVWVFFVLTSLALFRLRKTQPGHARPYRAWGYPVTPAIFLIAALALTFNLWTVRPVRSTIGLLVIIAGVPFFYRWRKSAVSAQAPRL